MNQRSLIIAVFGSSTTGTPEVAESLGAEIARRGHILLTGGNGEDPSAVKDRAIVGAKSVEGIWIGVEKEAPPPAHRLVGRSIQLRPGHGDRRNYIGASICDVAIAFSGGAGTDSEVAFCLAQGKSVVLLDSSFPFGHRLAHAKDRVRPASKQTPIDDKIALAFAKLDEMFISISPALPYNANLPLDSSPATVVSCTEAMVGPLRNGAYPSEIDLSLSDTYSAWLDGLKQ